MDIDILEGIRASKFSPIAVTGDEGAAYRKIQKEWPGVIGTGSEVHTSFWADSSSTVLVAWMLRTREGVLLQTRPNPTPRQRVYVDNIVRH